ncbi:hypothetical protein MELB17_09683 [Marinobacter sp. ELB17]|nr:hypothetical protein MELB17_09683 [Marinobacter sp. ELB17]
MDIMTANFTSSLCPETPIEGRHLAELANLMAAEWGESELRDLDLAMALHIPPNRISHFRHAKTSYRAANTPREGKARHDIPMVHPHQAILIRLLMRHPKYARLVKRPSNTEVWDIIAPFLPGSGPVRSAFTAGRDQPVQKKGFAPVFGRAAISSYKMLPGDLSTSGETSLTVIRLQMVIMSRFADIFRDCFKRYAANHMFSADRKNPLYESITQDWTILRERDSLTGWMNEPLLQAFWAEVHEKWEEWFNQEYLSVCRREALSRNLDPEEVFVQGNWLNKSPVTDEEYLHKDPGSRPITGARNDAFATFRLQAGITSSEMFWVLGVQVKAVYRYRSRGKIRIEAPTSILLRYFMSNLNDLNYFLEQPPSGTWLLQKIMGIDPAFKQSQLSPLFGSTKLSSYNFAAETHSCPHFARRLASIFARELPHEPQIYWQIRECVEDEVRARGLDVKTFWEEGRWNG